MLTAILIFLIIYSVVLKKIVSKENLQYYRDIPSDDAPAYVGKIIKGHVNGNDIIATILDLKEKGYIEIKNETIKGKDKKILILQKEINTLKLQEHETFLLKRIFHNSDRVVFDDYINSKKFKQDFIEFDKMLERKIEKNSIYKTSILKNINKIIFLIVFASIGVVLFYSLIQPLLIGISDIFKLENEKAIVIGIILSIIITIGFIYVYISYISKSTSERENINLYITYIAIFIIFGIIIITGNVKNIISIFKSDGMLYKIMINQVLSIIVLLYMFNIIKHDEKREYWYYFFVVVGVFSIIMNWKITMCINIMFFATYIFLKSPKHLKIRDDENLCKWEAFKRFLEDYSMLDTQEENAIVIWEKYLIYAISLGINKKVIKQYSKLSKNYLIDEKYIKKLYIEYLE